MMWLQGRPTRCQQPSRSCPSKSSAVGPQHPGGMGTNLLQARTSGCPIYRGTTGRISKKKELSRRRGKNLGAWGREVKTTTALSICPQAAGKAFEQLFISTSPFSWSGTSPVQFHGGGEGWGLSNESWTFLTAQAQTRTPAHPLSLRPLATQHCCAWLCANARCPPPKQGKHVNVGKKMTP